MTDPKCEDPIPTEFKSNRVVTGLNANFAHAAPQLEAFFTKLSMPGPVIDDTLGWMENEKAEPEDAALYFLRKYPDVWKKWVPSDVAQRVQAKL